MSGKKSAGLISGLKKLDFISHVNGRRVSTPAEFHAAVNATSGNVALTRVLSKGAAGKKVIIQPN